MKTTIEWFSIKEKMPEPKFRVGGCVFANLLVVLGGEGLPMVS